MSEELNLRQAAERLIYWSNRIAAATTDEEESMCCNERDKLFAAFRKVDAERADGKAQRPEASAEGVARSEPKPQKDRDMSESDSHEIIKAAEALVDLRRDDFGDVLPWDLMSPMEREYFLAQARVVAGIVRALSLQVEGTKP